MKNRIRLCVPFLLVLFLFSCSSKPAVRPEAFDPEKEFARANKQIEDKEYEEARKTLLEIKNRDYSKKFAPLAQLKIADSYIKEEEPELAISEYQKFLETYPDHQYASYAQYQTAMAYFNQIEGPERGYSGAARALEEFEKLKKMFPRHPYRDVVDIRIQQCRNTIADYEFLVGEFYYKKGSYNAAIGRLEGLMKKFPDYKRDADVLFYTGVSYKRLGQKDKATKYLTQLVEKHPTNKITRNAKKELATISQK